MRPQEKDQVYVKLEGTSVILCINDGVKIREKLIQGYRRQIDASEAFTIVERTISHLQNTVTEIASDYASVKAQLSKIEMEEARFYNKLFSKDRYEQ